ncbi:uncharacterized protein LOC104582764 [Brachypodium distachyon]|uniref:Uncharacterized protein n=1 Tax=Brachypodium distachyon TaxID=15368 RepID=A0A0Q3GB44_BRADI|nr:uncharacterized protein LOC104582764 [Brachypodium distachyon]KQK07749.1 hypothetical protein BRADI_2g37435v3 [Brachypodium distachyon]|eukprot:XP_010231771.1 uncharacterized protein LOC104582764 [Brachypodium distachyon]
MDVFDGVYFVRLRCQVRRNKYLAADDDGRSICLTGQRLSHNTVWAVQHLAGSPGAEGGPFVLLRGAYGRYLFATDIQASTGPAHGVTAVQHGRPHRNTPQGLLWQAIRRRRSFVLRSAAGRYLRANGKYLRWRMAVTVAGDTGSTMLQWSVEAVPARLERPTLVDPPAQEMRRRRAPATEQEVARVVRYVRAAASGAVDEAGWRTVRINTNSLMQLRLTLANLLGQNRSALHTTLCVRAGRYAELSPLLVNLPVSNDRIDIVIVAHGTPADSALRYPNVEADPE